MRILGLEQRRPTGLCVATLRRGALWKVLLGLALVAAPVILAAPAFADPTGQFATLQRWPSPTQPTANSRE